MIQTIHTKDQLKVVLKSSEIHAKRHAIHGYNFASKYRDQIAPGYLAISTSEKKVKKALHVYEVILCRMFKEGFSFTVNGPYSWHCPASAVVVEDDYFPMRVREKMVYDIVKEGNWNYRQSKPSGVLEVELYNGSSYKPSKKYTVTTDEDLLEWAESIISYMKKKVAVYKAWCIANEPLQRQREEEERLRKEREERIRERARAVKSVIGDIRLFEKAELLRKFCDVAEQRTESEEYRQAIDIARSVANWIDPTTDHVDEMLDELYSKSYFIDLL